MDKFAHYGYVKHRLDDKSYLILSIDDRNKSSSRRYPNSPFPLLSNIDCFIKTIGDWNSELSDYGLKTRRKLGDHLEPSTYTSIGSTIRLVHYSTSSGTGNKYLKSQYRRLSQLRSKGDIAGYWSLSWYLMQHSLTFRTACLNSWLPNWYKTLSWKELRRLTHSLNRILTFASLQCSIKNVWIESPKGKWRQLCVPPKAWRWYLHMLNMFITYIYEPHLAYENFTGFLYNRGCKSWWDSLLSSDWLESYPHLLEVDLSSGFPNLNRQSVQEALLSDGLLPPSLITLIMTHLSSPLTASSRFPTFETYVEHYYNQAWRQSTRSVHMGLGISPILFVITQAWVLKRLKLLSPDLTYKWYADDGSLYLTTRGLWTLLQTHYTPSVWLTLLRGQNPLVYLLNMSSILQSSGISLCLKKSGWVKLFGIWLKPYISLGLRLYYPSSLLTQLWHHLTSNPLTLKLSGWTRGRGVNPLKRKSGTNPCKIELDRISPSGTKTLNLDLLRTTFHPYLGLIFSRLYGCNSTTLKPKSLRSTVKRGSILSTVLPLRLNSPTLTLYNSSSQLTSYYLQLNSHEKPSLDWSLQNCNLERELRYNWRVDSGDWSSLSLDCPLSSLTPCSPANSFRKYSELKLSRKTRDSLIKEYKEKCEEPIVPKT